MNHQIDSLAYTNRLRGLPPTHKLSFAIALLILSLVSGAIVQLSIALWLAVWIVIYAGIPGKLYLRLLSLPLSVFADKFACFGDRWNSVKSNPGNSVGYLARLGD
ncbi:MAG: hypothetical protein U7126_24755 [Microcoleus sp.]